ncbi:HPr family phosphocarrier protein [Clostridiaceae bacterium NSJ-31]|uniref:HPr family phosphocarrier protein n=1 Tax=Ligaoa zhengdingensis TaxID=2763658 RepID=A0A926E245_9FIRM|nr:HPr family phosphocarrier protein [Ligaoa zhengdingensis]MBC8547395.1 HPr family phosphocarrier protein [Ligaoa zhengdingensis]
MVKMIKLETAEQLREFMNLAWECPDDVGVHTVDNKIADAKSVLGLMSLDYTKPVKVVTESDDFMRKLDKWAAKHDVAEG